MLCLSALRIIFVRILFAVCVSDGGFMFLKLDSVSVVKFCQFALTSVCMSISDRWHQCLSGHQCYMAPVFVWPSVMDDLS